MFDYAAKRLFDCLVDLVKSGHRKSVLDFSDLVGH